MKICMILGVVAACAALDLATTLFVGAAVVFLLSALTGLVSTEEAAASTPAPINRHRTGNRRRSGRTAGLTFASALFVGCGPLLSHSSASSPTLAGNATTTLTSVLGVSVASVNVPTGQELFRACMETFRQRLDYPANAPPPSEQEFRVRAACVGYALSGGNRASLASLQLASRAAAQNAFLQQFAGVGMANCGAWNGLGAWRDAWSGLRTCVDLSQPGPFYGRWR